MIEIKLQTEINKNARACWDVFGGRYADISSWMSGVSKSLPEGGPFQDAPISSRKIFSKGISFSEKLTLFSNTEKAFNYTVLGLPFVVKTANNHWKFTETNGAATLHMHLQIEMATGFGWLLNGLVKKELTKSMVILHKDFKHYMESGEVHPRKAKELHK